MIASPIESRRTILDRQVSGILTAGAIGKRDLMIIRFSFKTEPSNRFVRRDLAQEVSCNEVATCQGGEDHHQQTGDPSSVLSVLKIPHRYGGV